jgi:hypothetical protein
VELDRGRDQIEVAAAFCPRGDAGRTGKPCCAPRNQIGTSGGQYSLSHQGGPRAHGSVLTVLRDFNLPIFDVNDARRIENEIERLEKDHEGGSLQDLLNDFSPADQPVPLQNSSPETIVRAILFSDGYVRRRPTSNPGCRAAAARHDGRGAARACSEVRIRGKAALRSGNSGSKEM